VTLFDPSLHLCGTWLGAAINTYVAGTHGGPALNREVVGALQNVGAALGKMLQVVEKDPLSEATNALARPGAKTKAKKR